VCQKDGLIQVQRPDDEEKRVTHPKTVDLHIEPETIEQLLNAYFKDVAPMLPIVTRSDFLANPNPPPILVYSMCLVAAARREVPQSIFDTIRHAVNTIIKADDVLSTASVVNVQALLILSMTGDCHSQFVSSALSALWIRLGAAIRMVRKYFGLSSPPIHFFHRRKTLASIDVNQSIRPLNFVGDCGVPA